MDLALAGRGLRARDVHRSRAMATFGALVAVTAADLATGVLITREAPAQKDGSLGGAKPVRKSITVNRPREEVYAFWRDLTHLPQFMHHLEDVTDLRHVGQELRDLAVGQSLDEELDQRVAVVGGEGVGALGGVVVGGAQPEHSGPPSGVAVPHWVL